jgi:bacterioferritin-associated ferredoxin
MIVCVCHRVSDRDIARTAQNGCASFDELQFELLVATSCGKCHDCARETFHRHATTMSAATPSPAGVDCPGRAGPYAVVPIAVHHAREATTSAGA